MPHEYKSPEYFAQGLRDAFNRFGEKHGWGFSAEQSRGTVTFRFKGNLYSVDFVDNGNKTQANLETLTEGSDGKEWKIISQFTLKPSRSKTGRVPENYYVRLIKEQILSPLSDSNRQ